MKKILFITYDFPYPTNSGGKNRAYNLIKFGGKDLEIHLVSFTREGFRKEDHEKMKEIGVKDVLTFKRKRAKSPKSFVSSFSPSSSIFKHLYYEDEIEKEIIEKIKRDKIDVVHFESFYTGFYISKKIKELSVKQIFGTENIEYKLYEDYSRNASSFVSRFFYAKQAKTIKTEEEKFIKLADTCIAVTNEEADYIYKRNKSCYVIENGIDVNNFPLKQNNEEYTGKNLLFVGNFSYFPNVDAMKFFYDNVFSKISDRDVTLTIIGKNSRKLSIPYDPRINIIEFIDDIRTVYERSEIFVFPVRYGGGTNFKVIEAMAMGVPIVAFAERLAGLSVIDGRDFLAARSGREFREKINELFNSKDLGNRITKNARKVVEENYSWEKIGLKMNKVWKEI